MWNKIAENVFLFKNFMLVSIPVLLIPMVLGYVATAEFSWTGKKRMLYAWFLGRKDKELVVAGAAILQFLFVFSSALCGTEMELAHLLFLLALAVLKLAAGRQLPVFVRDAANSVLTFAAFLVGNILRGYLKETRFNIFVVIVLVLFNIFLVLYSAYFLVKDLTGDLIKKRTIRKKLKSLDQEENSRKRGVSRKGAPKKQSRKKRGKTRAKGV